MTGFAQHYDAAVERALAADARADAAVERAEAFDARAEASDARAEASMALNRELMARLAAERFGDEAGERLKSMLDGIVDPERFQEATAHVAVSRTSEELFAFFDKRR